MTTSAAPASTPLYASPIGLYQFQAEGVAYCIERDANLLVWDLGIGKSHAGMATAAMLFEDGEIDLCLIVCEKNKLTEWMKDLGQFTRLQAVQYHGDKAKRRRILAEPPQVMVSTYETIRNDAAELVSVPKRKTKKLVPSFFCHALTGKRVLVVYDEMTKLGNRSSQNHKNHALLIQHLRDYGHCRVMGLTGTPIERGPENLYNLGRILRPGQMPTVDQFVRDYAAGFDGFGNIIRWKNLDAFSRYFDGVLLRKRKTDPDVVDQFPQKVEEVSYIDLSRTHADFYRTVADVFRNCGPKEEGAVFTALRQIAGHPGSLVRSEGAIAKTIVAQVGGEALMAMGSAKLDRLVEYLEPLVKGQGAQVVIFTYFGQSLLPIIADRLEDEGYVLALNHGGMSQTARDNSQATFRSGGAQVFLTSDAGQRGINLPEASYCVHYELPLTFATYAQRSDRIHRIDSPHGSVTVMSFIARGTVEEGIANLVMKRNAWSDKLLDADADDDGFVSAAHRREMLRLARG